MQKEKNDQQTRRPSVFKELRESADLTQEELAYKLGKALSTIRRWENGGDEPKMTRTEWTKYCEIIGKSFDELPPRLSVPTENT